MTFIKQNIFTKSPLSGYLEGVHFIAGNDNKIRFYIANTVKTAQIMQHDPIVPEIITPTDEKKYSVYPRQTSKNVRVGLFARKRIIKKGDFSP